MCRHRIFQAAPTHKVFCGPKICRFPKIEEDLVELVHQRHSQFLTVNVEPIQIKAQELVPEAGLPHDRFKAICSWVHVSAEVMHCAEFSLHQNTLFCQKLPAKYKEKLIEF